MSPPMITKRNLINHKRVKIRSIRCYKLCCMTMLAINCYMFLLLVVAVNLCALPEEHHSLLNGLHNGIASNIENNNLGFGDNWDFWWSHSGISGPNYWGLLNPDWAMCHKGRKQSPIDIDPQSLVFDARLKPLQMDKKPLSGLMYNDGHAITFTLERAYATTTTTNNEKQDADTSSAQSNRADRANNYNTMNIDKQAEVASGDKSISLGQLKDDQPSVNEYSLSRQKDKDLLSVPSVAVVSSSSLQQQQQQPVSPASTRDYESIEDKSENGKQIDDNINASNMVDNDETTTIVELRGAGLAYTYRFFMLLIRFGADNQHGSEHQISSQSLPAEIQLLAYNQKLYKSYQEASTKPSGLLAVSVLVNIANSTSTSTNDSIDRLLDGAKKVSHRGKHTHLEHFDVASLLTDPVNFVTYDGSLTYPGCYESVTWIILNKPLYIKQSQLDDLRQSSADETSEAGASGNMIANNFRGPQPLNDRTVRTSISVHPPNCNDGQYGTIVRDEHLPTLIGRVARP